MAKHIGLIMDGNGRWAVARGRPRFYGHKAGLDAFKAIVKFAAQASEIEHITAFALSKDNFKRSKTEINALIELLEQVLLHERQFFLELGVKVNFIGGLDQFSDKLSKLFLEFSSVTNNCSQLTLDVALNYSGKEQLLQLMPEVLKSSDPLLFLDQKLEPIDLLIRTSGECRLSDFCLWQLAYAEIYFTDCFWPDFDEDEFRKALLWFQQRDRRFGELNE